MSTGRVRENARVGDITPPFDKSPRVEIANIDRTAVRCLASLPYPSLAPSTPASLS